MWEKQIKDIVKFVETIPDEAKGAKQPSRAQFTRLLSEPSAARRVPGIPIRMNENGEHKCNPSEEKMTRDFMKHMFNIDSKESLIDFQKVQFRQSVHYEQFMTFWKDAPLFDLDELDAGPRKFFDTLNEKAKLFYPVLQERGFYAWDINEYIGICRMAKACGIIDDKEFDEITDHFVRKAQVFYSSFKEYALSVLCGAMYTFLISNENEKTVSDFIELQKRVISDICDKNGPWTRYGWYTPPEYEWAQIYPGNPRCFITKDAFEKGIDYMYREEAPVDDQDKEEEASEEKDCGWRFFHGDEPDGYTDDPENYKMVSLNTILNMRPDILAFVEAPYDSAYSWDGTDWNKEPLVKKK